MTAGTEVVHDDVVRKVEIEDKCVAGLDTSDLNEVGAAVAATVDGDVNGIVGGNVKEDSDDSSYVFVSGSVEATAGDPGDAAGVNVSAIAPKSEPGDTAGVDVSDIAPKSDPGDPAGVDVSDIAPKSDPGDPAGVNVSAIAPKSEPGDTGSVNVSAIAPKSDPVDEVDQFKEKLGIESRGIPVDPLVLETNDLSYGSATVRDAVVKAVKDSENLENESTVDSEVVLETNDVAQDRNGHLEKITSEEGEVVESTDVVEDANGIMNVEAKTDDIVSGVTFDPESTLNLTENSQVTAVESEPSDQSEPQVAITQSVSVQDLVNPTDETLSTDNPDRNTNCEVMVDDGPVSVSNLIDKAECQVTVDLPGKPSEDLECQVTGEGLESSGNTIKEGECLETVDLPGKPSEDLECQVTGEGSESSGNTIKEGECLVTVDGSGKLSQDLACQATADGSESSGSSIKEQECQVSPAGSESIDTSVDKQECLVSVDGSESSGSHTGEEHSSTAVIESDRKSEEQQESLIVTSEVNAEVEPNHVGGAIKVEHQSESVSATCPFEKKETEGTVIGSGTESEENSDPGYVLSVDTDALVNGQVEKSDGILEMGGTQMSETEADEGVQFVCNAEVEKSEEKLEKQGEESSETLIKFTESVGLGANFEETKDQVKTEDEIQESHIIVADNLQTDSNLEDNTAESIVDAKSPLETETIVADNLQTDSILEDNIAESIVDAKAPSETETIVADNLQTDSNLEDNTAESTVDAKAPLETETIVSDNLQTDSILEDNTAESTVDAKAPLETETNIEPITHEITASQHEVSCVDETQESNPLEGSAENVEILPSTDSVTSECTNCELAVGKDNTSLANPDNLMVVEMKVDSVEDHPVLEDKSAEGMDCGTGIENVDICHDEQKETEVKDASVGGNSTLTFPNTYVNPGAVIEFGSIGRHETVHDMHNDDVIAVPDVVSGETNPVCSANSDNKEQNADGSQGDRNSDIDGVQSDEIPTSSVEGSVSDAVDVQCEEAAVLPYNFLIKIPRYEDETFRDQIRIAQLQVDEKTRLRDAIRVEIQEKRARLKAHNEAFNAAKLEETAARRLVRLKRQEIDSVQSIINKVKNAMSVQDIDTRIYNMEHMIQHETILLKDEKQFIREIKQLRHLRDQLASNMGTTEEVQQAIDQKDQIEEQMKTLRKELDTLKDKVSKAEAAVIAVGKKYDEESRRERELQVKFRAADDVRQKAYAHLNSLKKQSYDKNKNFRQYKEDVMAARDFASRRDKDALHRLCANQVEVFMEQWNNNDEFRKEYVSRCNMNASRRKRTLDGESLGADDAFPALPSNVNEKVDKSLVSTPGEVKSVSVVSAVDQGKMGPSAEDKPRADNKPVEKVSGQMNQTLKTKGVAKPTLVSDKETVIERDESIDSRKEEEKTPTKEEIELARKAEEEAAAKLKEQRRLEEKAKANEALERKKRNAEKAQIRAELRAKREAEQKEKEREKRQRKKEKKKAGGDGNMNGEEAGSSESSNEKETEVVKKKTAKPPPHFFSKQLKPKPIPPPLVNRNKKRWQQWGRAVGAVLSVLILFAIGNSNFFKNLDIVKYRFGANPNPNLNLNLIPNLNLNLNLDANI